MKFHVLAIGLCLAVAFCSCSKDDDQTIEVPVLGNNGGVDPCPDEDIICPTATLCIRNPTTDQFVLYSWNSNLISDTIFPGECATVTANDIEITCYVQNGQVITSSSTETVTFATSGASYGYTIDDCYLEFDAPGGYFDPAQDCDNGNFDPQSGEHDTDCGGYCPPCNAWDLSCAPATGEIEFDALLGGDGTVNYTSANTFFSDIEVRFEFTGGGLLTCRFNVSELPNHSRKFLVGNLNHRIAMSYQLGFSDTWTAPVDAETYLIQEGPNDYRLVFCDLTFSNPNFSDQVSADLPFQL